MMHRLGLTLFLCASACTTSSSDHELDQAAIDEGADGKADTYSVTRLERATPTQVAKSFQEVRGDRLTQCFEAYKSRYDAYAIELNKAVTDKFGEIRYETDWTRCDDYDLAAIVNGVLANLGVTSATLAEVIDGMPAWAKPQLETSTSSGYVTTRELPIMFYEDLMRTRDANAMAKEKHPAGVDLAALREQWKLVRNHTTLDSAYLNPVTFPDGVLESDDLFKYLRAAFPLSYLTLESTYYTAVSDFATSYEGPGGDPAFEPIATMVRKRSIKKRFYFSGGGEYYGNPWSSNVLIVIDEHGQAWGMQMGYSE